MKIAEHRELTNFPAAEERKDKLFPGLKETRSFISITTFNRRRRMPHHTRRVA